jgi:hypothetical protein
MSFFKIPLSLSGFQTVLNGEQLVLTLKSLFHNFLDQTTASSTPIDLRI